VGLRVPSRIHLVPSPLAPLAPAGRHTFSNPPPLHVQLGLVFVALLLVGTAALVTVPVTLTFAELTDDAPFEAGQAVLPQLGYVVLALFAHWKRRKRSAADIGAPLRQGVVCTDASWLWEAQRLALAKRISFPSGSRSRMVK